MCLSEREGFHLFLPLVSLHTFNVLYYFLKYQTCVTESFTEWNDVKCQYRSRKTALQILFTSYGELICCFVFECSCFHHTCLCHHCCAQYCHAWTDGIPLKQIVCVCVVWVTDCDIMWVCKDVFDGDLCYFRLTCSQKPGWEIHFLFCFVFCIYKM